MKQSQVGIFSPWSFTYHHARASSKLAIVSLASELRAGFRIAVGGDLAIATNAGRRQWLQEDYASVEVPRRVEVVCKVGLRMALRGNY